MQASQLLLIILALFISVVVAFFQYFYKNENKTKVYYWLFSLKFLAVFLLLILLINPKIKKTELNNRKPILNLLIDNSQSIAFFNSENKVKSFYKDILDNKELNDKFSLNTFVFDAEVSLLDSLSFNKSSTNIYKAISSVDRLSKNKIAPTVVFTDGNQTNGLDYEFLNVKQPIYPIVFGDTARYKDLKISQLNVNKYTYLHNTFPVEVFLNYEGKENITSNFVIRNDGKKIYSRKITFSETQSSKNLQINIDASKKGIRYFSASLEPFNQEKNILNNSRNFSVEVIDEQSKILILSSVVHPDIGTLKNSIERNKQRSVFFSHINAFTGNIDDYQLVILYQPNQDFKDVFQQIKNTNSNFFLITGANTNWSFLNKQQLGFEKKAITSKEEFSAYYNSKFLTFLQEDIGFNNLPSLVDYFGEINFSVGHQELLFQQINGIQTQQPLVSVLEKEGRRTIVLFGEGIWRWRSSSYLASNNFKDFDTFLNTIVQFLALKKKRERLSLNFETLYAANDNIQIGAFYTDNNYQFDSRAFLELTLVNTNTKKEVDYAFSLQGNSYQLTLQNLEAGSYTFKVSVSGQQIAKTGAFKITPFNAEEQFTSANHNKLLSLAEKSSGKLFYSTQSMQLVEELLENKNYFTVQEAKEKEFFLIDWKLLLFLLVTLLSIEWFVRKYFGKI
ncbi:vWA domain-containing protein [Polaribacter tangerinus]|uniref:vWA domain-containing protein n=1 Tax=Polaribacter tangerinus TaxID=1920034 RepID=UPI001E36249D|nr:vWA domain-containing protein [Polaribacter tangerinus]